MAKRYTDYSIEGVLNINNVYSFPIVDGLNDQVLTTDGLGNVTWEDGVSNSAYTETAAFVAGVPKTIAHNLGTADIHVQLIEVSVGGQEFIQGDIYLNALSPDDEIDITVSVSNTIRVVVLADGGTGGGGGGVNLYNTDDSLTSHRSLNGAGFDLFLGVGFPGGKLNDFVVHSSNTIDLNTDGTFELDASFDVIINSVGGNVNIDAGLLVTIDAVNDVEIGSSAAHVNIAAANDITLDSSTGSILLTTNPGAADVDIDSIRDVILDAGRHVTIPFLDSGKAPDLGDLLAAKDTLGNLEWVKPSSIEEICGIPIDCTSPGPIDGDTLIFNSFSNIWEPNPAGGLSNLQEVFDTGTIAPPFFLTINDSVGILPGNSILMGTGDAIGMMTGGSPGPATVVLQLQPIGHIQLQCKDLTAPLPDFSSGSIELKGESVDGTARLRLRPGGTELYTPNSFDHDLNNGSYSAHDITTYDIGSSESIHLKNLIGTWTGSEEIFIESGRQENLSNLGSSYIKLTEPAASTGKIEIGTTWDQPGIPTPTIYTSKIILGNADQSISLEANGGLAGIGGNIRLAGVGLGTPDIGDILVAKDVNGNVEWADPKSTQLWIQTTFFNNLFSQTSPTYTYPHDYMEWTSNASGDDVMPVLIMPFACRLLSITFRWCSENGDTVTIDPGERFFVDIGTVTPGTGATPDNWTSKTGTVIGVGTTVLGEGIMELTNADSGTIPSISNSMADYSPAQDIVFAAGDEVAVIGFEVGPILPNDVDAQCCMVFEMI